MDAARLPAHRAAGSVVVPRSEPGRTRRTCIRPASGCGWRWDATSSPRTTCARCGCGGADAAGGSRARALRRAAPADAADPGAAARSDDRRRRTDAEVPVRAAMLSLTQLFNITGHPAIALPAGRGPEGLPRSLQLVGHRGAAPSGCSRSRRRSKRSFDAVRLDSARLQRIAEQGNISGCYHGSFITGNGGWRRRRRIGSCRPFEWGADWLRDGACRRRRHRRRSGWNAGPRRCSPRAIGSLRSSRADDYHARRAIG